MEKTSMRSSFQTGVTPSKSSREMELSLDVNRIPRGRRNPKIDKEINHQVQLKQRVNYQEKLNEKCCSVQPCNDVGNDLLQPVNSERSNSAKASRKSQQGSVKTRSQTEELVRYMSNVPGFLQRMEKGENIQDKALNVGVLDWGRLEKWKGSKHFGSHSEGNGRMSATGKSRVRAPTLPGVDRGESSAYHVKQLSSGHSSHKMHQADDSINSLRSSMHKFTHSQDFESTSKGSLDGQKIRGWNHKPFEKNSIDAVTQKRNRTDMDKRVPSKVCSSSLDSACSASQIGLGGNSIAFSGDAERHQARKTSDIKVVADRISSSSFMASSSELKDCDVSLVSKDKRSTNHKVKNMAEATRNSTTLVSPKCKHGEKVILLVPRKRSQGSFSEEPRASTSGSGKNADLNGISNDCSHERRSSMISSDNPRSFPLPPRLDTRKLVHCDIMMSTKDGELSSVVPRTGVSSAKHISKRSLDNFKVTRDYDSETQSMMDANQVVRKDGHASPNRGFLFSLGRLTRSFSLKESSTISAYESVKSGPVTSQSFPVLSIPKGEMGTVPSRARSSPLRRLLDPLFKSKAPSTSRSTEQEKSMKETKNSLDLEQINGIESVQSDKQESANIQAVLHVRIKNGLPVFKFLVDKVDGKSSILAATKNVSSPRKSNSGCSYTFYAIDEIKKRSGSWINSGSKDKRCDYTYNVIGQMNVNHSPFLGLTGENLTGHETVSEYVLFGLEVGKKGETSPKLKLRPSRELGAVIVRTHSVNVDMQKQADVNHGVAERKFSRFTSEKGCYWSSGESELSSSVTVILPAAVHGLPEKGGPWPLIQRWRSGGSCDCGGWDVGCGLCVLSAAVQVTSNGVQLFAEGGGSKEDKPVFVMRPADNGMYSIEFNRRMSLVQAFFISVTIVHSQKPSDLVDLTMEKVFEKGSYGDEQTRKIHAQDISRCGATAKFTPSPPLSPVGRV
ncbi:hypothetical protein LINPERHAP1_LOCUS11533 [Linum perenne]